MKKKILASIIIAVAVLISFGCGKKDPQTATLVLESNPTTGYTWEAVQTPPIFDMTSEYVPDENEEGLAGAGGKETFVLTPKEAGQTSVTFEYGQHWEGGETGTVLTYEISVDKNLQITVNSMAAEMAGDIDEVPEAPEFVIE